MSNNNNILSTLPPLSLLYTEITHNLSQNWHKHKTSSKTLSEQSYRLISLIVGQYLVPFVCLFGIVGNILNLLVLTRKRLLCSMKHMERSVNTGLVALAVSDMMYCTALLLTTFIIDRVTYTPTDNLFALYFSTYKEPLINIFFFNSTWLTVVMAVSRYAYLCIAYSTIPTIKYLIQ